MNKIKQVRQQCEEEFCEEMNDVYGDHGVAFHEGDEMGKFFQQSQEKLIEAIIKEVGKLDGKEHDVGYDYAKVDFKKLFQESIK